MTIEELKELKKDVANTYIRYVPNSDWSGQAEETSPEGLFIIALIDAEIARQSITDEDVKKAIELLDDTEFDCIEKYHYFKALDIIKIALEQMQPWISVEESLPEIKDDSVLAYFANGSIETVHIQDCFADMMNGFDDDGKQLYTKWYMSIGITHWMPLPTPPKGENDA
jgi:hypothetical protein